jgi:hypothetical protein
LLFEKVNYEEHEILSVGVDLSERNSGYV